MLENAVVDVHHLQSYSQHQGISCNSYKWCLTPFPDSRLLTFSMQQ